MPVAIRVAMMLLPKSNKMVRVVGVILLLPVVALFLFTSTITVIKHVPAIQPEQIKVYKDAVLEIETETGLMLNWRELVAIDAVRHKQDFRDVRIGQVIGLAKRFVEKKTKKDKDGETIEYYVKKSLDRVLAELVAEGELQPEEIEEVKRYLKLPWETLGGGSGGELPDGYVPVPSESGLVFPLVGQWRVSDVFKHRINPKTGKPEHHNGIDLAAAAGTPIVAAKTGTVIFAGPNGRAGNNVDIKHEDGTKTRYLHMLDDSILVSVGQVVEAGQQIGAVGSTGESTGNHLHFEYWEKGKPVDPAPFLFAN